MRRCCTALLSVLLLLLAGCVTHPDEIQPVDGFVLDRYLGTWYEIARHDHRFERGLQRVSATYTRNEDGSVRVLNRGFSASADAWEEAVGKASFVEAESRGYLKVSFFGPFYGAYVVFGLDDDYQVAYVGGPDHDYLWLLARTPTIAPDVYEAFLATAAAKGYDTTALLKVAQ